jgi:signal transduction histidine kinase
MKPGRLENLISIRFFKQITSVVFVLVATLIQYILWDYIRPAPYLIFYPAVIVACLYGNGLIAIFLSMFSAQYMFIQPFIDFTFTWPHDIVRHLVFFFSTFGIKKLVDKALESKSKAEEAVKLLKEEKVLREMFVSTLSHDLQTPLTAIKLSTHIMIKHPDNDPIKYKNRILSNAIRIENMIRNLLDSNQITAGKPLPISTEDMELVEVVKKTVDEMRNIHGDRFKLEYSHPISGRWSPDALQRILENLCSNAVKYGAEASPITIKIISETKGVQIIVQNWGNVIPEKDQLVLFDTFLRLKPARESSIKGWGLGLTLVKALSEAMGGHVEVESSAESGTRFIVKLPWHTMNLTSQNTESSQLTSL